MYALYARLVRPLAILIGRQSWLPKFNTKIVAVDRFLQRITRGRIGVVKLGGLTGLMLSVVGVKSGVLRHTPLLCVPHADGWLIAGSNWGAPKPPAWVANIAAAHEASVNFDGREYAVLPREVTGEERDKIWIVMVRSWPNYAKYQERTDRDIRVFFLQRV